MITYMLKDALYINLTNRCPNNCSFCIRNHPEGLGYNLWLQKEPSVEEIIEDIKGHENYSEVVFCGYGEPLIRFREVIEVAKYLKSRGVRVRVNTNGQANLIWGRDIVPELHGLVDAISISLNAADRKEYARLCSPDYGEEAFDAVLEFAGACVQHIPEVWLTVVDIISAHEIEVCRVIADEIGAKFRVRHYY